MTDLKGTNALIKHLEEVAQLDDVRRIVRANSVELGREMKRNASFVKGYQTGTLKRDIHPRSADRGLTGRAGTTMEYAPYLINGTRYMEAQDFLRPAFYKQRQIFLADMERLMK